MISLAMIVKNEEKRIGRCLAGVKDFVGEMIVVDTGSSDRTKDAARELGAIVSEYPFQGDFSAARNVSLSACRGEWILVLDADEFFPLSAKLMIETAVDLELDGAPNPYRGYYLLRHNYEENSGKVSYSDYVLRLFRNGPNVRYAHRVHETVEESLDRIAGKYGKLASMPLSHYLFERADSYMVSKQRLYLEGLLKDISDNPTDASRYDFLGCEYARAGRLDDAERAFRKFIELDPQNPGGREALAVVLRLMGRETEADEVLKPSAG